MRIKIIILSLLIIYLFKLFKSKNPTTPKRNFSILIPSNNVFFLNFTRGKYLKTILKGLY